ncbi:transmembrane emp24 domain-containing protein p24delta8, partial [Quercus suber]
MELELKKMYDIVISIQEEMFYLLQEKWDIHLFLTNAVYDLFFKEEEMQVLNKTTNNRMAWLSFLSLIVCLSVAGLQ